MKNNHGLCFLIVLHDILLRLNVASCKENDNRRLKDIIKLGPKHWTKYTEKIAEICLYMSDDLISFTLLRLKCANYFVKRSAKEVAVPKLPPVSFDSVR